MAIVAAVGRAGAVDTDNTQGDSILATKSCPAPSSKACGINSRSHAKLTSFSIGEDASATPLGLVTHARVDIVSCDCASLFWRVRFVLQVQASEVWQSEVRGDAVPVESKFLNHCAAWLEPLDGCKEVF